MEKELAKIGIETKFSSIKWDYWQTILSRGSSELGSFMIEVYKEGGGNGAYKHALKNLKIDVSKSIEGFAHDEILPWDIIENYVSSERLKNEYQRLMKY